MVGGKFGRYMRNTCTFFIYLLCHIYPGVPHQCAALFSLGLLHYMHDKTNINQHTFSYNTVTTVTTWYIHHYHHLLKGEREVGRTIPKIG